ncbi:MoxR family ATPase [Marispirochaeta sp.]|uniref:AAA family ATPase n=1 Tax=Marispirochaeta sp. TaxID=2038653 RepID=UPI0029C86932|nr:MoxR family ATPase [Marispirochaeta sp.]
MSHNEFTMLAENTARVVVGKQRAMELLTVALLAEGHVLLEDVPGLGKTLMAKSLAKSIDGSFRRIQFTPDLLPADITGFSVYDQKSGNFVFHPGPIMCNVLLADEINRTIPRTQSSLLESMGEFQVTVDGNTMQLPKPFFVIATQNPIEMDGTFPLPEAQLDRFLMRIDLGYPSREEEIRILERFQQDDPLESLKPVIHPERITELQHERSTITISAAVREYIADIVAATRRHPKVRFGVSPRGAIGIMRAAQGLAVLRERDYVLPDDIKELAGPVLEHRIIVLHSERTRGASAQEILREVLSAVAVPVPV